MKSNTYPETEQGNGGTEIAGHSHNQCDWTRILILTMMTIQTFSGVNTGKMDSAMCSNELFKTQSQSTWTHHDAYIRSDDYSILCKCNYIVHKRPNEFFGCSHNGWRQINIPKSETMPTQNCATVDTEKVHSW
jgi:hypothetical protein